MRPGLLRKLHMWTDILNKIDRRVAIVLHDIAMVAAAWMVALSIRYDFSAGAPFSLHDGVLVWLPAVLVIQGVVLRVCGLYRGLWRFASVPDLLNILRASMFGTLVLGLLLFLFGGIDSVPRSTMLLYPVFLTFFLGGPRFLYRIYKDRNLRRGILIERPKVLILGAGTAGEFLVREMRRRGDFLPLGLLDDNLKLKHAHIHGVPVLGQLDELRSWTQRLPVDMVVIAMPSADSRQMQRVVNLCELANVPFRTVPKLQDLTTGRSDLNAFREVSIDDLLGREPVRLDWMSIRQGVTGKVVLVTGGGGSIGSELCRQIARLKPKALIVVDQSEFNLYTIETEITGYYTEIALHGYLEDITDSQPIERIFSIHKPQVVFHAAAYKHVPLLERQARLAIRNNILGTAVVAQAAENHGVKTFVMVSTDKAVNPTNVMGASKRFAEMYCQALNAHSRTHFTTIRFGNVLGSAGSVVPLFSKQIEAGGPVTITHPDVNRFFMTITEACQLILQASTLGKGGEIFVLDMGQPITIRYLAEQMIRLTGKQPEHDIKLVYTGLRPGEKLYEELFYANETRIKTEHEKILLASAPQRDWHQINELFGQLQAMMVVEDNEALKRFLMQIIHDATPPADEDKVIPITKRKV